MKKIPVITIILSVITLIFVSSMKVKAEETNYYTYNNGVAYLDEKTVPQSKIAIASTGQIIPLQDSIIRDSRYAFIYKVSDSSILTVDAKGNWQALKPGVVTLTIRVPERDEVVDFEEELNNLGVCRASVEPTVAYAPKVFTINVLANQLHPVYRLYQSGLKTHIYTSDGNERDTLMTRGWNFEGTAWSTRSVGGQSIYRLYHPGLKVHHYTMDTNEYNVLGERGWNQEGIAYQSTGTKPIYRLYNNGVKKHLYTMDENEKNVLSNRGWKYEGIAWMVE